jgi:ATP-dependent DNA helicase RecG
MKSLHDVPIQFLKGVGPARAKLFERLGVSSIEDLFYFFPRRYEDRRNLTPIAQASLGEFQTVAGNVLLHGARRSWYTKKHVSEIVLDDGSGRIVCVWFNQPYLERYFTPGVKVVCHGKVQMYKNRLQMIAPEYELIEGDDAEKLNLNRIVPVYPLTRGITQRSLRKIVHLALDRYAAEISDELPVVLRNKHKLFNIKRSIRSVHFPDSFENQEEAVRRVCFEEFYFFQVTVLLRKLSLTQKRGVAHQISDTLALNYISSFSFELTKAQKRCIREIRDDMQNGAPMLRLLQGDVGSGKTVVALFGCYTAVLNGHQAAIMAPTEILARQHFDNISRMMESGLFKNIKIGLLISELKKDEKEEIHQRIAEGKINLVIGTHALLSEDVRFKDLSFVVIDEQHKFGVRQRSLLSEKGINPDILIMTATPIPRTLCITLFGDLDISVLDELPPGRGKIKTYFYNDEDDQKVYQLLREEIKRGRQAYVVYPIIEESEKNDLKAAEQMYKQFKDDDFKDCSVGLIHGRMKKGESQKIMEQFKNRKLDVLVATTVLEVGVDVPNANVMVVEHAERFGLAQLHQLRGRIGRGKEDALCFLIGSAETQDSQARLEAVVSTTDGFKIAEKDLEIRGPGQFFGRHQHGLTELKIANPATQMDILELARKEAIVLTNKDPKLQQKDNQRIKQVIHQRYPTYLAMVEAG